MKTAIYIEDGKTQLVLTPESDFEQAVVSKIEKGEQEVRIYTGEFYACQGGWTRQRQTIYSGGRLDRSEDSLIIVMEIKEKKK